MISPNLVDLKEKTDHSRRFMLIAAIVFLSIKELRSDIFHDVYNRDAIEVSVFKHRFWTISYI